MDEHMSDFTILIVEDQVILGSGKTVSMTADAHCAILEIEEGAVIEVDVFTLAVELAE